MSAWHGFRYIQVEKMWSDASNLSLRLGSEKVYVFSG